MATRRRGGGRTICRPRRLTGQAATPRQPHRPSRAEPSRAEPQSAHVPALPALYAAVTVEACLCSITPAADVAAGKVRRLAPRVPRVLRVTPVTQRDGRVTLSDAQ